MTQLPSKLDVELSVASWRVVAKEGLKNYDSFLLWLAVNYDVPEVEPEEDSQELCPF